MSAENALLKGDDCYSKGQFDESIKWYTQAANEGYVEGMEKLLKTCVEQGKELKIMAEGKGLHYWGMASSTLRGIMTHAEIGQEVKDRSYVYYDEIMYGLAIAFMWVDKYDEAHRAWTKVKRQDTTLMKVVKAFCDYKTFIAFAQDLANHALDKKNLSPEERKDALVPFISDGGFVSVFEQIAFLDEITEKDCERILQEHSLYEIAILNMALFTFTILYYIGFEGNVAVTVPDVDKSYQCWKILKILDTFKASAIPESVENQFQERLKEEKSGKKVTHSPKETPLQKVKTNSVPQKRKVTISRPKLFGDISKMKVYLDGVETAILKNGESITLEMDGNEHNLKCKMTGLRIGEEYTGQVPADGKNHTYTPSDKHSYLLVDGESEKDAENRRLQEAKENDEIYEFIVILLSTFERDGRYCKTLLTETEEMTIWVKYDRIEIHWDRWNAKRGISEREQIGLRYVDHDYSFQLKADSEQRWVADVLRQELSEMPHISVSGGGSYLKVRVIPALL